MFNMEIMSKGADAFGRIAESIEDIRDVARAIAWRDELPCPHTGCVGIAAHDGEHYGKDSAAVDVSD